MGTFQNSQAGAVWTRQSSKGDTYYQGEVAGKNIIMFPQVSNNPKAPAFTFKYDDREDYKETTYDQ